MVRDMRTLTVLCALVFCAVSASAQTPPPIHGVTGTYVPEETITGESEGAHGLAAGIGHVVGAAKKLLHFGGKGTAQEPLAGFEGRRVVVRDGGETTEGVVIDVNRGRQQITVRIALRKTLTLRLAAPGGDRDITVSYTDDAGARVARDFRKAS